MTKILESAESNLLNLSFEEKSLNVLQRFARPDNTGNKEQVWLI